MGLTSGGSDCRPRVSLSFRYSPAKDCLPTIHSRNNRQGGIAALNKRAACMHTFLLLVTRMCTQCTPKIRKGRPRKPLLCTAAAAPRPLCNASAAAAHLERPEACCIYEIPLEIHAPECSHRSTLDSGLFFLDHAAFVVLLP